MQTWRSNCLIEALKRKVGDWSGIGIIPIWHGWHFHVMWLDKRKDKIFHFTHKSIPGLHTSLWFKGQIEEVDKMGLRKWCQNNHAITMGIPQ